MKDWKKYYSSLEGTADSADIRAQLAQVGKTQFGQPVDPEQIDLIVDRICNNLSVRGSDCLVDLGCGNGLLTARMSQACKWVLGVDFSPVLIASAQSVNARQNAGYVTAELAGLKNLLCSRAITIGYSYEVWQHLSVPDAISALSSIRTAFPMIRRVFIGSIPDLSRIRNFYNTKERWELYLQNCRLGREQIGHWWTKEEMKEAASGGGFKVAVLQQNERLYTSHYRFDAILTLE